MGGRLVTVLAIEVLPQNTVKRALYYWRCCLIWGCKITDFILFKNVLPHFKAPSGKQRTFNQNTMKKPQIIITNITPLQFPKRPENRQLYITSYNLPEKGCNASHPVNNGLVPFW